MQEIESDGGYSGGGGDITSISKDSYHQYFELTLRQSLAVVKDLPRVMVYLDIENRLPQDLKPILDTIKERQSRSSKIWSSQVVAVSDSQLEVVHDKPCYSASRGESHAAVDYNMESKICVSSQGLDILSKHQLHRKLTSLIAHELTHMLGFEDEEMANMLQDFVYSNFHMFNARSFTGAIREIDHYINAVNEIYSHAYKEIYKKCLISHRCSYQSDHEAPSHAVEFSKSKYLIAKANELESKITQLAKIYQFSSNQIKRSIENEKYNYDDRDLENYGQFSQPKLHDFINTVSNDDDIEVLRPIFEEWIIDFFKVNYLERLKFLAPVTIIFEHASRCNNPIDLFNELTIDAIRDYFQDDKLTLKNFSKEIFDRGYRDVMNFRPGANDQEWKYYEAKCTENEIPFYIYSKEAYHNN